MIKAVGIEVKVRPEAKVTYKVMIKAEDEVGIEVDVGVEVMAEAKVTYKVVIKAEGVVGVEVEVGIEVKVRAEAKVTYKGHLHSMLIQLPKMMDGIGVVLH